MTGKDIGGVKGNIAIVDYEILKAYKGGEIDHVHRMLLPPDIEVNHSYLLFLIDNDESVTQATRSGSVFEAGSDAYKKIIKNLE